MPEIEKEKEIEIEKKNVKSIAGHIIDEKTDEKEKREPESVLDVDEHMSEKQKLSLMNKQQKREYILEYYAPKALFALVVVGIVVFLVVKHFTAEAAALNILAVNTTQQGSAANLYFSFSSSVSTLSRSCIYPNSPKLMTRSVSAKNTSTAFAMNLFCISCRLS